MEHREKTMEKIVNLCKNRGFIFPGSDIYGGLANTWDYAQLGVLLKNNIKKSWWTSFVERSKHNIGIDSSILMNSKVWEASGHISGFNDPLIDCKNCKSRFRADQLIDNFNSLKGIKFQVEGLKPKELYDYILNHLIPCPDCGKCNFTEIREFNLMFKTNQGVIESSATTVYLRPETAQGIFVNFKSLQRTSRKKLPFGVCQIGKSFRNEITPGNFIFRTREFEQMELEFFCTPGTEMEWFSYLQDFCKNWLVNQGISEENLRARYHKKEELAHYSNATMDFEYLFPFGWGELYGIASRTDYDLKRHMEFSGVNMEYTDPATSQKYIPYVVEPSVGVERVLLSILIDAYDEEQLEDGDTRVVLRFKPHIAPYKVAIFPLVKKLSENAYLLYEKLSKYFVTDFDESGAIGKRYRRHDEIGTPFCITFDFDSIEDNKVTIRDRDTMEQQRLYIDDLIPYIQEKTVIV